MKTFTLAISVALFRRPEVSAVILAHYAAMQIPSAEIILHAVGSEPADRKLAEKHGWIYTEASNENLGAKRNAGLEAIRKDKPGAVLRIGSDDLLSAALIDQMVRQIKAGSGAACLEGVYMLDKRDHSLSFFPYMQHMTMIGAPVLNALDWKLYSETGVDAAMRARVQANAGALPAEKAGPDSPVVMIKTGDEINGIDRYRATNNCQPVTDKAFLDNHFALSIAYLSGDKRVNISKPGPSKVKKTESNQTL